MDSRIGTGKELFSMSRKESTRPVMVKALGTNWNENYCFVIERIDFWGRPVGTEFMNGKSVKSRKFRIRTLLQMHETTWKKEIYAYYGYSEPIKQTPTPKSVSSIPKTPVTETQKEIDKTNRTAESRTAYSSPVRKTVPAAVETNKVPAKEDAEIIKNCRNCRNYKNQTCNGMRKAETCPDYVFMPSATEETKAMWPKEMLASYYRRKDAERHREH